jgi:hypothetical protein
LNLESLTVKRKSGIITELRKDYTLDTLLAMPQLPVLVYHYHQQTRPKAYQYEFIQQEIERLHIKKHFTKAGYQRI